MVTFGALVIAVPLGVACAAFLSEVASPRIREVLKPAVEILAGIPSVVVGFLGIVLLNPLIAKVFGISNGLNALNGGGPWSSAQPPRPEYRAAAGLFY